MPKRRALAQNLRTYINGFSADARDVIEQFEFDNQITRLADNNLLYLVVIHRAHHGCHRQRQGGVAGWLLSTAATATTACK